MSSNPSSNPRSILDTKRTKIEQALAVLEEAAKETKEDVTDIFKEKYSNTKSAFKDIMTELDFGKVARRAGQDAEDFLQNSRQMIRRTATQVDHSVHQNPWVFLGATALVGLTLGLLVGRRSST